MAKTTKTTQNTGKPSWMKNAATAVKYSAEDLFSQKAPFVTNTVRNAIDNTRELTTWVKQNNPFRSTSGSKDPLIRQIQNTAKRGFKAAKQDLSEGNLRFEKLNKEFSSFVGEDDFGFDFDFDFGGDDSSFGDWNSDDTGDSDASFGDNLNEEYFQLASASTTATVSAIGESTSQVATAIFSSSEASTNKLIAANLTNFVKLSGQIESVHNTITTIDKNVAQIVSSFNEQTQFLSQAQTFMEHQEQTLNDIKAILAEQLEFSRGGGQEEYRGSRSGLPSFLESGFNLKEYAKYILDESVAGPIVGMGLSTLFKVLKIDKPSILENHEALPLSTLFNLGGALEKLFPSIKKITDLDNILQTGAQTFLEKMDAGDYGGFFNILGMLGFGVPGARKGRLDLSGYNKDVTQWTGKSERAIQEVIPNYLSRIEVHVGRIADKIDGNLEDKDIRDRVSLYNYDNGRFESVAQMVKKAQETIDSTVQLAFTEPFDKLSKIIVNSEDAQQKMTDFIKEFMKNENESPTREDYKRFREVIDDTRNANVSEDEKNKIYHSLVQARRDAIKELANLRRSGSDRSNYLYNIAPELNELGTENVQFLSSAEYKRQAKESMTEEERRKAEREEEIQSQVDNIFEKFKNSDLYKGFVNLKEKGGPINQFIGKTADEISDEFIKRLYGISDLSENYASKSKYARHMKAIRERDLEDMRRWQRRQSWNRAIDSSHADGTYSIYPDTGRLPNDEIAQLHQGEIVLTSDQSQSFSDLVNSINRSRKTKRKPRYKKGSFSRYPRDGRIPETQDATVDEGEIILTSEQSKSFSDLINSVNEARGIKAKLKAVGDFAKSSKSKSSKFKRRDPVTQEEAEFIDDLTNPEIERATTDEDQQREIQREMSDNIRTIASVMVSESNERSQAKHKSGMEKILEALFGERDENGFFTGDNAEIGNWFIDVKNYIKHLFSGKGYLKSSGETVEDSVESVKSTFGAFKDATVDQVMKTIYGENSEKYQNFKGRKLRSKNSIGDAATPDGQTDLLDQDLVDQTNEAIFGGNDPSEVRDQISRVADVQNTTGDKIRKGLIGGISGALITTGLTPNFGLLPKLLLPGGPIGGALLGVGASLLSRNDYFMDMVFGEEQDGERIGGIISKDIQDTFKKHKGALLLGSTLGAGVGLAVPEAVTASLGIFGKLLLGSGPIGGAVLGIGTSLLLNSEKVKTALFGDDQDQRNMSTFIRDQKEKIKGFISEHKDKLIGIGVGGGVGALAGASLASSLGFGAVPLILLSSTLGVATGLASTTDRFKDFFLGTRTNQLDDKGNPVRMGDGLLGRIGRMFELEVIRPVKDFSSSAADKFIEWVRYDIVDQYKAIGENLNDSISRAFNINLTAITDAVKKPLVALATIPTKIMGILVKGTLGSVGMAAKIAGGVISAPGKLIRGITDVAAMKGTDRKETLNDFKERAGSALFGRDEGQKRSRLSRKLTERRQQAVDQVKAEGGGWFAQKAENIKQSFRNNKDYLGAAVNVGLSNHPILSSLFGTDNEFYADEKMKYAKTARLEDSRWFMKDVNKRDHKNRKKDINDEATTRKKATKLASKWAAADGYNDTIDLSPKELAKRNKKLKKLYGKDFKTLNKTEMLEFIYDPEGKKKKKKEEQEKKTADSQQATIDTSTAVNETRDALTNEKSSFWQIMTDTLDGVFGKFFKKDEENEETTPDVDENVSGDQTINNDNTQENQDTEIADLIDENNAADSGKAMQETNTKPKNGAETSDDRDVDKKDDTITVDLSDESVENLNESSPSKGIFDKLFSKKGLITTAVAAVGIPVLIKFIPWVVKNFPDIMNWFKETGIPAISTALQGIGTFVQGICDFITGGQNVVKSTVTFINYGTTDSQAAVGKTKSQKALGLMNYAEMTNYLSSKTGAQDALDMDFDAIAAEKGNKSYNATWDDMARLALIYLGTRVLEEKQAMNPNIPPEDLILTYEELEKAAKETSYSGNNYRAYVDAFLEKAAKERGSDLDSGSEFIERIWDWLRETDYEDPTMPGSGITWKNRLLYESAKAVEYINGDRGNLRTPVETAVPENVGDGIGYGHFMQNDPRWGGRRFAAIGNGGYTTMANGGCGPTTLANVAYQMGINTSPDRVASMAVRNGYTADGGSNARLFNEGASRLGLRSRPIGKGAIANALSRGSKIILAGKGNGNGIYTNAGHIISARGLDSRGNAIVDDPLRKNPLRVPINKLTKGLTNAWSIGRGPNKGVNKVSTSIDNIAEYESTKHIYDDIYNTSSIHTTNIADYQRLMGESKIKEQRLKDAEKYKQYYDASVAERKEDLTWYDNGRFGIYHQIGSPKWSSQPLGDNSGDTIGRSGCVISAFGSILSYLTGLNFNPLFYTEKLRTYDSNGMGAVLPEVLKKASEPFTSLKSHEIRQYDESYYKNDPDLISAINSGYPVVVYNTGGATGPAFRTPSGKTYNTHAMVFKPDTVDPSKGKLYDPGSTQPINNSREFNTDDFFSNEQGIDRIYYYSGTMPTLDEKYAAAAYYSGQLSLNDAISWGSKGSNPKYSIDGSDIYSPEIAKSYPTTKQTSYSSNTTANGTDSDTGNNMLTKIISKLGELAGIYSNVLVSLFGGKYQSYYANNNPSPTSTDNTNVTPGNYTKNSNDSVTSAKEYTSKDGSLTYSTGSTIDGIDYGSGNNIQSYDTLPDWSKQNILVSARTQLPSSSRLSSEEVNAILSDTLNYIFHSEVMGDYNAAHLDGEYPSIGIGGFRHINAAEIYARIKNSNLVTDPALISALDQSIIDTQTSYISKDQVSALSKTLEDSGELSKNAQDAYLAQLQMDNIKLPIELYDQGVFNDPRSLVLLGQFGGFGPTLMRNMLNNSKGYFQDKSFSDDELTNTAMVMNDYYTRNTGKYVDGHRKRIKRIYQDLGGENTTSLGFGAGVADSLNTSSYDIVDTPYALNEPQEVKMDVKPVTSRIDVLIELLKKIYTTVSHPVTVNNPATTSGQNIGQGKDALTYSRKLSEAGKNTEHVMPMFEKENANARDKLRLIHNRIAKSPRTM